MGPVRTPFTASLLVIGLVTTVLAGCQVDRWSERCSTDTTQRSCEISVSGNKFNDLPFPVSGPMLGNIPDRFRLETASAEGSATFSAGGTEGGTFSCEQGQTISIGDSSLLCRAIGDNSLDFTISRVR
ncbi:hypothetical protein GCM10025781_25950 [Kocuria gwangalliensis]|uniref:Lipoprotein n=1 Tax=Kocuria gwangalliensis TaxID=501592 RepID=A0ABP8XG65_9MICC